MAINIGVHNLWKRYSILREVILFSVDSTIRKHIIIKVTILNFEFFIAVYKKDFDREKDAKDTALKCLDKAKEIADKVDWNKVNQEVKPNSSHD